MNTVRHVAGGHLAIPDDAVRWAFRLIRGGTALTPSPKVLMGREREILTHFASRRSYAKTGKVLGVNMETARNAIYRVQDKPGMESKQEIVVWSVRNGLLDGE